MCAKAALKDKTCTDRMRAMLVVVLGLVDFLLWLSYNSRIPTVLSIENAYGAQKQQID